MRSPCTPGRLINGLKKAVPFQNHHPAWVAPRQIEMLGNLLKVFSGNTQRSPEQKAAISKKTEKLALYDLALCPYSIEVRLVAKSLELDIEKRSIQDSNWASDLLQGGGKIQAPCLRIEEDDGSIRWLYESGAIILYLRQHYPLENSP